MYSFFWGTKKVMMSRLVIVVGSTSVIEFLLCKYQTLHHALIIFVPGETLSRNRSIRERRKMSSILLPAHETINYYSTVTNQVISNMRPTVLVENFAPGPAFPCCRSKRALTTPNCPSGVGCVGREVQKQRRRRRKKISVADASAAAAASARTGCDGG